MITTTPFTIDPASDAVPQCPHGTPYEDDCRAFQQEAGAAADAQATPAPKIRRVRHCDRCGHVIHGDEAAQGRCRYCQGVASARTDLVTVTVTDVASGDTRRYGFATAVDAITWCEADMDGIEAACRARGWRRKRPVTRYHLHANGDRVAILALSHTGTRYRATTGVTVQRDAKGEVATWNS